jgi:hypothetical protein
VQGPRTCNGGLRDLVTGEKLEQTGNVQSDAVEFAWPPDGLSRSALGRIFSLSNELFAHYYTVSERGGRVG